MFCTDSSFPSVLLNPPLVLIGQPKLGQLGQMFDIVEEVFEVKVKLSESFKDIFLHDTSVLFDPDFIIISEALLGKLGPIVDILKEGTLPDLELLESFKVLLFF